MYSWSVKVHRKVCHCHCHCYSKRTVCATARWVSSTNFYPSRRAAQMVCSPRFRAWHWYSSCRRRSAWRHIRSTWTPGTAAAADATWCVEQRRCRRRRQLLQPVSARASLPRWRMLRGNTPGASAACLPPRRYRLYSATASDEFDDERAKRRGRQPGSLIIEHHPGRPAQWTHWFIG